MKFEGIQPEAERPIEYTKELLRFKMTVEVQAMLISCGIDATEEEKMNWVEKYSAPFRIIFDRRIREEGELFLEKCKTSSQEVALEISDEMTSEQPLESRV